MRCLFFCVCILSLASPLAAGEPPIPGLGEHQFVPVTAIREPFITTILQTSVSLGVTNATVPILSFVDSTVTGEVPADQFLAGLGVRYQHAVNRWLAAGLSLGIVGRLGTSTTTVVAEGLTGNLTYELGWLVRIHESRKFILSGSALLGNYSASIINVKEWAEGNERDEEVPLVRSSHSLRGSGGLQVGWGVSRRFGLLGSILVGYAESFDDLRQNAWDADVRAALSYDASQDIKVPLGVALTAGRFGKDVDSESESGVWFWNLRLASQSRSNFTVGIELGSSYFTSTHTGIDQNLIMFNFDMRYYY